ncbi:hypothetical protein SG34_001335 [Thalassomonas viridans]|uniref:Letm1 RBD domain-containing protein n=1 Tax=Thalassomonas viridans TaxID=137584 RepID=A0AAE9Z3X5_9GAMM|nr:hypothetical protein [Thalassomonas viridans]WDE05615.1 hypothetical protein SG34_001335 [Thalassomonas viridans]
MKIWVHFVRAPVRVLLISRKRNTVRLKRQMVRVKIALAQEKTETKEMLVIYRKYTQGNASEAEMKMANRQFLDLLKGLGLGVFVVLPFAPITIPVMIKVGKWVGVDIIPSSFSSQKSLRHQQQKPRDKA